MSKLFTLGCSLTWGTLGWAGVLSDKIGFELVNSGMYAGSNGLQVRRMHNYIVNNQIDTDDIIIWQVTSQMRAGFSLACDKSWRTILDNIPDRNPDPNWANCQYYIDAPANFFDGTQHVDVLSNHPLAEKASTYYDFAQSLEELLSMLILLNNNYKVLVFVGWPGALDDTLMNFTKFIKELKNNNVPHMPESMMEYVINNDLELDENDPSGCHPSWDSSIEYAEKALYPKLQDLGWINV